MASTSLLLAASLVVASGCSTESRTSEANKPQTQTQTQTQTQKQKPPLSEQQKRELHDDLFKKGSELVFPYFRLADNEPADSSTAKAKGELERGISFLAQAIELNAENWSAYWLIGKAEEARGNFDRAYKAMAASYRLQKEQPDIAREYVALAMRLGKSREAVDAARHAVALVPDNAGLKANLGLALLVHGDVEEALRTTKAALSAAPDDPITKNLLGLIEDVRDGKRPRPTRWPED